MMAMYTDKMDWVKHAHLASAVYMVYFTKKFFMSSKRENSYIVLGKMIHGFLANIGQSFAMLWRALIGKKPKQLKKGKFLQTIHFIVFQWPKNFWKKPTGIKIGRSLSTLIHVIFFPSENKK